MDLQEQSHRRLNILTGEWILCSPHRTKRPWQGKKEALPKNERPSYDPNCYLCPGNTRAGGKVNPNYTSTFAFTNDFAALQNDTNSVDFEDGLLTAKSENGICRVLCYSPDHSKTMADLSNEEIVKVIDLWKDEFKQLSEGDKIAYVQIFENKGSIMGCSNPHPHGQIWAQSTVPMEVQKKSYHQKKYFDNKQHTLLSTYLDQELTKKERILYQNEAFVVLVPFWALWPYETMILPKTAAQNISSLSENEQAHFADALSKITKAYDQLFEVSFPYSAGIHQAPCDGNDYPEWHWHMSFYPPLLRSATVKKFMVGYEMFAEPQRDITAEMAASKLRALIESN